MVSHLKAFSPREYARFSGKELGRAFLVPALFRRGRLRLTHWETDRTIVGGAMPVTQPIELSVPAELRADYFLERREMGVINLGGRGQVFVDGRRFAMDHLDSLYLGRGTRRVKFASREVGKPARFYLLSYPAHASYPLQHVRRSDLQPKVLGASETENLRVLHQVIIPGRVRTCQLVMGFTLVQPGSKWNTMPPHTHLRRSEVYCYFGFPRGGDVKHFVGHPARIRSLRLREGEAVLSPPWSVHCGEGSSHYGFVWGMGGENQDYADMDPVDPALILKAL